MFKSFMLLFYSAILLSFSNASFAVPPVTGNPVVVQHLGKIEWPADRAETTPYLTQLAANDINDLHGDVSCVKLLFLRQVTIVWR